MTFPLEVTRRAIGNADVRTVGLNAIQLKHREQLLRKLADGSYKTERVQDCLCGCRDTDSIIDGDRFGLPVAIVICKECGLLRTSPRLAGVYLPAFYDNDYHGLHFGTPQPKESLFKSGQGTAIYQYVRPFLGQGELAVVEIGAASGSVLREFAAAAARDSRTTRLTGCEYSAAYAAEGRRLGTDIREGGIEAVEDTHSPGLLILSHVVEHFPDMQAELARLRALCGPETLVYVEVPGVMTIHQKPEYDFELVQYFTLAHTYHFTLSTLTQTMVAAGFVRLSGDECVRSVFRPATAADSTPAIANACDETVRYLAWLRSSRRLGVRRSIARACRLGRHACLRLVRRLAGEPGVDSLRRLRNRLRAARG